MSDPDENAPYMNALRAYETERQEQFAAEVDAIQFDVSDLRCAMSQLVRGHGKTRRRTWRAFLSADFNLTPEVREVHAAYIGSWIKISKNVKRVLFTTCSYAQKAAEYLRSLQPICGEAPAASPQDRGLQLVG
ncbi:MULTISPECIES: hypothetical protein [Bradyrhizobium]|uniref:hypothetical protein n=1 Tax=Bradyrhizobium TaxID=374 RepID=UPI0030CAF4D5